MKLFVPWVTWRETWYPNCRVTRVCGSLNCATWLDVCDVIDSCVWRDSFMCVTRLIPVCNMTHSCVWHDSFVCVTWLIHVCDMIHSCAWHDSFMCVTWLFHVYELTHSCVWHNSFSCMPWLFDMGDMTHPCVCEDSFLCVTETLLMQRATWYSNRRITTHSCAWRDSCIIVILLTWRVHSYHLCVTWLIHVCETTHSYMRHDY